MLYVCLFILACGRFSPSYLGIFNFFRIKKAKCLDTRMNVLNLVLSRCFLPFVASAFKSLPELDGKVVQNAQALYFYWLLMLLI